MRINHHIIINRSLDPEIYRFLHESRINYSITQLPGNGSQVAIFDINEFDPDWMEIQRLLVNSQVPDLTETYFSNDEIENAKWLRLIPLKILGYPQPEEHWQKNHPNYKDYCSVCGTYSNCSEFILKKEVYKRKFDFGTLNWTSTLFCSDVVRADLEREEVSGLKFLELASHKGEETNIINQIQISNTFPLNAQIKNTNDGVICPNCQNKKYIPHTKGILHFFRDSTEQLADFMKTKEWFGSGRSAFHEIIVSNRVGRLIIQNNWQGVRLKPIELDSES